MDQLIHLVPDPETPPRQRKLKPKYDHVVKKPKHSKLSSKQVEYNIPVFSNFDKVIFAKPTHDSLTYTEVRKAGLIQAMYEEAEGETTVQQYLKDKVSNYELLEKVSDDVMVVRNRDTGENKVVVKGIDFWSADDHIDLQRKIWKGDSTRTYNEALELARKYNATEIIGHSRGGSTAIAVAQELGIESTGFNSVITTHNVWGADEAHASFKHTEFANGDDHLITGINDLLNPNPYGKYPENFEFKMFGGVKGAKGIRGQHDVAQWIEENLNRNDTIDLPFEELAFKSRHAGDLITGEMFAKGIREGKTYREILHENEGGFGIVDDNGRFTPRNFRDNNMSKIFQAVGGEHTPDEIAEMDRHGRHPDVDTDHILTENELTGLKNGAGADMINHALDDLMDSHARLPELPSTTLRTVGKGIYRGVTDSLKPQAFEEGLVGGLAGEAASSAFERTVGKLPGELGELQHSTMSFGVAAAFVSGAEMTPYGLTAGLVGEAARYGTDELLKKLGAGEGVRGNVDALVAGASSGSVLGSAFGPVGSLVGGGVGAVLSEGAYVAEHYADKISNFFQKIF